MIKHNLVKKKFNTKEEKNNNNSGIHEGFSRLKVYKNFYKN